MDTLPREIAEQVLSFLDARSKRYLRQTNSKYFNLVDYRDFVFYFTRSTTLPEMVQTLSRYNKPISIKFTKTINLKPQAINHLSALTNIMSLSCDGVFIHPTAFYDMSDLTRLTNLQFLKLYENHTTKVLLTSFKQLTRVDLLQLDQFNSTKVLQSNSKLKQLDLDRVNNISDIQNISHVTSLTINGFIEDTEDSAKSLEQAHRLKSLSIYVDPNSPVQLPLHALTSLKSLALRTNNGHVVEQLTRLAHLDLEELTIGAALCPEVTRTWTTLTSLKKLALCTGYLLLNPVDTLQFLTALSKLSEFTIPNSESPESFDFMALLSSDTLTYLSMEIATENTTQNISRLTALQSLTVSDYERSAIDYQFLTNLTKLTKLVVYTNSSNDSLRCIQHLINLQTIAISSYNNILSDECFNFSKLPNLESLDLPTITTETFATLLSLTKITRLMTMYNFGFIPHVLESLPLKKFRVTTAQDEKFWQSFVRVTTLESLSVSRVTTNEINLLTALHNLTALEVYSSEVDYKCYTQLTSLQRLFAPSFLSNKESEELMNCMPYLHYASLN